MPQLRQVKFADYRLDEKEKKAFINWEKENGDDLFDHIQVLLHADHKVSITYSDKDQTTIVSVTCWAEMTANYGYCTSSRHSDPRVALSIAVYKILVILADTIWAEARGGDDWG
ncbi:MAG: hypothetical protein KAJ07_13380 [Planctomycetes bacterium]|nr:hypothetical protein [Planctomycetota bacterium]